MKILSSLKHKVVGGVAVAVAAVAIAVPTAYAADYWTSTFVSEDYDYSSAEAISYRTVGVWAEAVQDLSSEIIRPQLRWRMFLLKRVVLQHIGDLMSIMPELDVFNTRNK